MNSLSCTSVLSPLADRSRFPSPRRAMLLLALIAGTATTIGDALTAGDARADETSPAARDEAQAHFKKARELYSAGSYREAAGELDAARTLDPHAKDLVFNHGVVMERLSRFDDALADFHQYEAMDLTAAERSRAEATIRRLEGAKREADADGGVATGTGTPTPTGTSASPPTALEPQHSNAVPSQHHEHSLGPAIVVGSLTVVDFAVASILGASALAKNPKNYVTDSGHSYTDYTNAKSTAKTEATASTVLFAVGVVGLAATAILYFTSDHLVDDEPAAKDARAGDGLRIRVGQDGALVGGTF